jgi:transcriptional regulator with XRE-family HTH domain
MQTLSKSLPDINHLALKSARENYRLSQEQLAKQLCLSAKHIDQLENQASTVFFSLAHKIQVAKKVACHLDIPLGVVLIDNNLQSISPSENDPAKQIVEGTVNTKKNPNYKISSKKINELTTISLDIPVQYAPVQKTKNYSKLIFLSTILAIIGSGTLSAYLLFDKTLYSQSSTIMESDVSSNQPAPNNEQALTLQTNSAIQPTNGTTLTPNSGAVNNPSNFTPKTVQANQ